MILSNKQKRAGLPFIKSLASVLLIIGLILAMESCGNRQKVIDDFGDASFELVNQDSQKVVFPDDFKGKYVVAGFIYTNCPDICGLIMQNLGAVQELMNNPSDIEFVAISFDPQRDTPSRLKKYAAPFGLDEKMVFLTGDTTEVYALLDSARVRTQVSMTQKNKEGKELYFLNHSDKIIVLNKNSEMILEYGGSMTKPSFIVEDLKELR